MKLQELIFQLERIASNLPQADVVFQFANVSLAGFSIKSAHLWDVSDGEPCGTDCLITVGDQASDAEIYKNHIATLKRQRP